MASEQDPAIWAHSPNERPLLHNRRPDMVVCSGCGHFREKDREGVVLRRTTLNGRPPSNWRRECLWFQTAEGRRASAEDRMSVMVAGANGGRNCPRVRRQP